MIDTFAQQVGIRITDQTELPPRTATFLQPPPELHADVRRYLDQRFPNGLYGHQSKAIAASLAGNDICLSTSTASGKSLVFMSAAADLLKRDGHARVVAFYPVRALIQDQLEKWKQMVEPLGFSVGSIDGSVETSQRSIILLRHRVVLMTPDVAHAWFMSNLPDKNVGLVRKYLGLIILDETHVYDGVFGSNMAFFLRRFQAVCKPARLICSTATLGQPNNFVLQLTGRQTVQFGADQEGTAVPKKTIFVARFDGKKGFETSAMLLKALARQYTGRFIAFADSRKMVELMTAAAHRAERNPAAPDDGTLDDLADETANQLVPYRAGYESDDRNRIQQALGAGQLRGVVSTSALELGLDIGEVSLVVLLTTPPTMKAFWQRLGRAGRRNEGQCLLLDTVGMASLTPGGVRDYLKRPIEPNWLYLPNRFIQYTNALCATQERQDAGELYDSSHFATLPLQFAKFVEQELNPTEMLAPDLFALRQRSQGAGPQREFPLRSGVERNFKVECQQSPMGNLTFPQVLREAYPGAVYYYMARPFRIIRVNHQAGEILAQREARYTTQPITQVMVFPDLVNGLQRLLVGEGSFVAEAEMQVSERVLGFKEKRGPNETTHDYGVGSPHSQRPLQRFIRTTGVCWFFPNNAVMSDVVAQQILAAFCREFAVQSRELGIGRFHVQQSPLGTGPLQGICIFDATHGSMRLTERLGENFAPVVRAAHLTAAGDGVGGISLNAIQALSALCSLTDSLTEKTTQQGQVLQQPAGSTSEWLEVVAPNEKVLLVSGTEASEATVTRYFFSPEGLKYQLLHENPGVVWTIKATDIQPLAGITKMLLYNPSSGEEKRPK